jgi:UDP-N-acetylglucosamine acyltransferase
VHDRVRIGAGTVLSSFVTVLNFVEIGADCRMAQHVVLGGEPQDHGFKGEESWVRIGRGVLLRENVTVNRSTGEGSCTVVGDESFLMEGVHIGHNSVVGKHVTMANKVGLSGFSFVGDGAVMGGMSGIHQFVRVGAYCMIGGLSKIVKDIPPYLMADGHPASIYSLNKVGMRRAGFDASARAEVRGIYDELFRSGLPFRQALENLSLDCAFAEEIRSFCRESKRGVSLWTRHHEKKADDASTVSGGEGHEGD